MSHGWTGGQYSLYRVVFGTYLFLHFSRLIPWGGELLSHEAVVTLLTIAAASSVLFAAGWFDRTAALVLLLVGAFLAGRHPLLANPGLAYVGCLLLAHLFIRPAPYGAWSARGRVDPRGGWSLHGRIYGAAWVVLAVGYAYSGYTKLLDPSLLDGSAVLRLATWGSLAAELAFAPLALFGRVRPFLWGALLSMQLSRMLLIEPAHLGLGLVMLHLFTFDPRWVRPSRAGTVDTLLYDGSCGLCHRAVRFVLAEDRAAAFRFAPLGGETFRNNVPASSRLALPDSLVIATADGRLVTRASGVRYLMQRLGGVWRCLALASRLVPTALLDRGYDLVAAIRHRLFRRPQAACPILPDELRDRFGS